MRQHGFIFSLDAFVAFTLTMITISLLIFTIGTPKPYYYSLEQTHQLAHDTLQVLAASSDDPLHGTYLEQILGGSNVNEIMFKVAGGKETNRTPSDQYYRPIIPKGFGYSLERYSFSNGAWDMLYDSGDNSAARVRGCNHASDRCGRHFTKLQASATTFGSVYIDEPKPGASPYCYLSCFGYARQGSACNVTPCSSPTSNFLPGNNSIAIVRLTVYT
jgi:hypothetical protein